VERSDGEGRIQYPIGIGKKAALMMVRNGIVIIAICWISGIAMLCIAVGDAFVCGKMAVSMQHRHAHPREYAKEKDEAAWKRHTFCLDSKSVFAKPILSATSALTGYYSFVDLRSRVLFLEIK
jgi:hypothetical protein